MESSSSSRAPIALFAYRRPAHLARTLATLQENPEAAESRLYVFSDGPKGPADTMAVDETRRMIQGIKGFSAISHIPADANKGLARSIIEGVDHVLRIHDRIIVLEDDLEVSPHFLAYMNDALDRYAEDSRVVSIHGYVYPVQQPLPEAFFLPGADCWGWATWRRGWAYFNPEGRQLLAELKRRGLLKAFDYGDTYPYAKMLERQTQGKNDSWAIRWYASAFLAEKLTLYPGRSLVRNIGNDASGTHCGTNDFINQEISTTNIDLRNIAVTPSVEGRQAFANFFRQQRRQALQRAFLRLFPVLGIGRK